MRKCKHKHVRFTWQLGAVDRAYAAHCQDCGAVMSPGPSNDVGCEVEIRAARLIQYREARPKRNLISRPEWAGLHGFDGYLEDHEGWWSEGWWAGAILAEWLACDNPRLETPDAWPWDPTRPIAEQGPVGAFAQVAAEHATFNAAAERYDDLRLSAAKQLVATLVMHSDPAAPDHAKQCEQLCNILKAAESRSPIASDHFAAMFNAECDAAIASADAKQVAMDAHGYGGKSPIDSSQLVGLSDSVPSDGYIYVGPDPTGRVAGIGEFTVTRKRARDAFVRSLANGTKVEPTEASEGEPDCFDAKRLASNDRRGDL